MKIIAYILFALQILSMAGHAMNGGIGYMLMVMFRGGIPGFIGFMLPTIAVSYTHLTLPTLLRV